jgi:hypothetical protein
VHIFGTRRLSGGRRRISAIVHHQAIGVYSFSEKADIISVGAAANVPRMQGPFVQYVLLTRDVTT